MDSVVKAIGFLIDMGMASALFAVGIRVIHRSIDNESMLICMGGAFFVLMGVMTAAKYGCVAADETRKE